MAAVMTAVVVESGLRKKSARLVVAPEQCRQRPPALIINGLIINGSIAQNVPVVCSQRKIAPWSELAII